jgi:hypothetical protein
MAIWFIIIDTAIFFFCLYNCYKNPAASLKVFVILIFAVIMFQAIHEILYYIDFSLLMNVIIIHKNCWEVFNFIAFYLILPSFVLYTCFKMKLSGLKSKNFNQIFINFAYFRPYLARIC